MIYYAEIIMNTETDENSPGETIPCYAIADNLSVSICISTLPYAAALPIRNVYQFHFSKPSPSHNRLTKQ